MPFKSEAQRRLFYVLERQGELKKGTTRKWEEETPEGKLPEHVKRAAAPYARGAVSALKAFGVG